MAIVRVGLSETKDYGTGWNAVFAAATKGKCGKGATKSGSTCAPKKTCKTTKKKAATAK